MERERSARIIKAGTNSSSSNKPQYGAFRCRCTHPAELPDDVSYKTLLTVFKLIQYAMNPKQIVADGYDQIAERYIEWSGNVRVAERERYLSMMLDATPRGARVLDLGCGPGIHTQPMQSRFELTAVEISQRLVAFARKNIPRANVLHADMTTVEFPENSFDGVCAFYSLIHVPRNEHGTLLHRIANWLRPSGLFIATMGCRCEDAVMEQDWLGAPMFWSSHDTKTNKRLVEEAGFDIVSAEEETAEEFGDPITFLWIVARKDGI